MCTMYITVHTDTHPPAIKSQLKVIKAYKKRGPKILYVQLKHFVHYIIAYTETHIILQVLPMVQKKFGIHIL